MTAKLAGYRVEGYTRLQMEVGDHSDRRINSMRRVAKEVGAGDIPVPYVNTSRGDHEAMLATAALGDQITERGAGRP